GWPRCRGDVWRGGDGRAEADRVLRVRVDGDPRAAFGTQQLGHQRDAAGAADEQYPVQLAGLRTGPVHDLREELDGAEDLRPDQRLQLRPAQRDVPCGAGQQYRDRRLGVGGQRLLRVDHGVAELGQPGGDRRVGVVQRAEVHAGRGGDVPQQRVVEV